jgi:hypothetical protein
MRKSIYFLIALGCINLFSGFNAIPGQNNILTLRDQRFSFTPKKFYIADVADKRTKPTVTALLIGKDKNSPTPADFTHGTVDAIKKFLGRNLHRDTMFRPILLTINEFKLNETRSPQGEVDGNLKVNFSFSSQLSYKNKHLVDYISETHYHRAINDPADVELKLRQGIVAGVSYFNNWMNTQKKTADLK